MRMLLIQHIDQLVTSELNNTIIAKSVFGILDSKLISLFGKSTEKVRWQNLPF